MGWIYYHPPSGRTARGFIKSRNTKSSPPRMQARGGQMIITEEIMAAVWASESTQHWEKHVIKKDNKINKSAFWVHINISLIS